MINEKKLERLAKSNHGKFLVEYLEQMKSDAADVRKPLSVKPELANDVRLGVVQILDEFQQRLKILSGRLEKGNDDWN